MDATYAQYEETVWKIGCLNWVSWCIRQIPLRISYIKAWNTYRERFTFHTFYYTYATPNYKPRLWHITVSKPGTHIERGSRSMHSITHMLHQTTNPYLVRWTGREAAPHRHKLEPIPLFSSMLDEALGELVVCCEIWVFEVWSDSRTSHIMYVVGLVTDNSINLYIYVYQSNPSNLSIHLSIYPTSISIRSI